MRKAAINRQLSLGPITQLEQHLAGRFIPLIPTRIAPNYLTISHGIFGMLAGLAYVLTNHYRGMLFAVNICIVFHWLGDALDGALARYRGIQSNTGFYLDHFLDAVVVISIFTGMYASNLTTTAWPLVLASLYLLLEINVLLQTIMVGTFDLSVSIFGPAEAQFLLIVGNVLAYMVPNFWDAASLIGAVTLFILCAFAFLRTLTLVSYEHHHLSSRDKS